MKKHRFELKKLARDKIPEIMNSSGIKVFMHIMQEDEYRQQLVAKLYEETREVAEAHVPANIAEELSDVLEVLYSLAAINGYSPAEIESIRQLKKIKNGGFEKRIYLDMIELDSDNPEIERYRARPKDFPEIKDAE